MSGTCITLPRVIHETGVRWSFSLGGARGPDLSPEAVDPRAKRQLVIGSGQDAAGDLQRRRLQSGAIEFEKVGRHRRVTLCDVVAYQTRAQSERRAALAELAKDSIEHHGTLPKAVPSLKRLPETEA